MTLTRVQEIVVCEEPAPFPPGRIRDPREPPEVRWPAWIVLTFFCLVLFFYGIGTGDLWRAENLRALVAREILRSGDWIVPRLYGEPYLTKPPVMYAAIALASSPFGDVLPWTARLPSALAASATVWMFYWYFARALGRRGGLLAALVLPAAPMWLDKAGVAEIDMLQVAWVTGAVLCFLRALECTEEGGSSGRAPGRHWWLLALLCVAGGVLTKWTAPVFFYATAVSLLWWRGRLGLLLSRQHLLGVALAGSIVLAWAGAVIVDVGWSTFIHTVGREGLARIVPQNYGRPYLWREVPLHPLRILGITLPWSAFALLTLRPGFAARFDERGRRLLQALHCWTWPNLILWSFVAEHAPRHSFPFFPAIAGLAALVWAAWVDGRIPWRWSRATPTGTLTAMLICWLVVKVVFVQCVMPSRNDARQPRARGAQLAALVPPDQQLYVLGLKDRDEGILFHYGRPVLRLHDPQNLPLPQATLFYCLLEEYEWKEWPASWPAAEIISRIPDELGSSLVLVRLTSD
jgi:4-amino-4-deoxy-L-arabinose transferase-like glycosyltransferase